MANARPAPTTQPPVQEPTGCLGVIVRLSWMAVGPALLFFLLFRIAEAGRATAHDVLYWAVAVGLIVLRRVDITRLGGQTANGDPACLLDWRRYALGMGVAALGLWGFAHTLLAGFMK